MTVGLLGHNCLSDSTNGWPRLDYEEFTSVPIIFKHECHIGAIDTKWKVSGFFFLISRFKFVLTRCLMDNLFKFVNTDFCLLSSVCLLVVIIRL